MISDDIRAVFEGSFFRTNTWYMRRFILVTACDDRDQLHFGLEITQQCRSKAKMDPPTSAVTVLSVTHGRERRLERNIAKRYLQEAIKYDQKEKSMSFCGELSALFILQTSRHQQEKLLRGLHYALVWI